MQFRSPVGDKTARLSIVAVLVAFSSFGLHGQGVGSGRRAHLSSDLTRHQARNSAARERVIVHGTEGELDLLASRHRLRIFKRMRGAAVMLTAQS
jgi:hypothetical protein